MYFIILKNIIFILLLILSFGAFNTLVYFIINLIISQINKNYEKMKPMYFFYFFIFLTTLFVFFYLCYIIYFLYYGEFHKLNELKFMPLIFYLFLLGYVIIIILKYSIPEKITKHYTITEIITTYIVSNIIEYLYAKSYIKKDNLPQQQQIRRNNLSRGSSPPSSSDSLESVIVNDEDDQSLNDGDNRSDMRSDFVSMAASDLWPASESSGQKKKLKK